MNAILRKVTPILTILALLGSGTFPAQARGAKSAKPQSGFFDGGGIISTPEVVGITVGIAAVGAAIGIGTYYAVKHNRNLVGCAVSGSGGLELTTESDLRTYALLGDTAAIQPGERVRVSGKKKKRHGADAQPFLVEKVAHDFGPCKPAVTAR